MLVLARMALALVATYAARRPAHVEHLTHDLLIRSRPARRHGAACGTDIGTIQV
jgi:hypothetical protein